MNTEEDRIVRLVIGLQNSMKRLERDSRLSVADALCLTLLAFPIGEIVYALETPAGLSLDTFMGRVLPCLFLGACFCYNLVVRINRATRLLTIFPEGSTPVLVLDSAGLTCPLVLLPYQARGSEYWVGLNGQKNIYFSWRDATRWEALPGSRHRFYRIVIAKGSDTALDRCLEIRREFSQEEEQNILAFVRRHISDVR
jgi:hypothetical protein